MKLIKICFTFLFFGLIVSKTAAQNNFKITGIVRDSLDNAVLGKSSININFGEKTILVNESGRFEFVAKAGEIVLIIKHIGYVPNRIRFFLQKDIDLSIKLRELSRELEQVVVNAKSAEDNIKKPLMGVSSLNIKTLERIPTALGEVDILRGLQMLPGVSSVGEASNGVNIRGGTTDQNLMLLDDAPIFNPTHMFGLFAAFPSEAVSSFDLYKGNVPARFGGRTAAVLDIAIAKPSLDKTKGQIGIGLVSNKFLINTPIIKDKLGILVSGRLAVNDWLLPIVSKKLEDIKAKFADGAIKLFYKTNEKNTFTLSSYYSYDFIQTKILGSINNINSTSTQYDYRTLNFSAKWFVAISPKFNLQTSLISSNYTPKILLPELNSTNKVEVNQSINYKQIKVNGNYILPNHIIEGGVDATNYLINPGELLPGTSNATNYLKVQNEKGIEAGVFLSDEINLGEKLIISAGARYSLFSALGPGLVYRYLDENNISEFNIKDSTRYGDGKVMKSYGGLEPRIGISYQLTKSSSLKFGFNQMRQYLQVISNTTTPIPTSRWKTSDQNIKPQISKLFSAGIFKNLEDNIYEISAEGYYRTTENVLDYKAGASFLLKNNLETEILQGLNKSYGIEMMLSKKKGELTGWINYTYSRSFNQINMGPSYTQQVNNGDWYATNYDRPHAFNAALVFNQAKMHDFSFNFSYSTGRPFTIPGAFVKSNGVTYPFYNFRNNSRIPNYHRLDFSWNIYNPVNKDRRFKGNWNFIIYNLYGRKNAYSIYLKTEGSQTKAYKLTIFGAPIISLSYNLKF